MPPLERAPLSITVAAVCAASFGGTSCNVVLGINEPEEVLSVRYYPWDGNTADGAPSPDHAGDASLDALLDASLIDVAPDSAPGVLDSSIERRDAPAPTDAATDRPRCFRTADAGLCGFGCGKLCGLRSACVVDADCESKRCYAARCILPTCLDGVLSGDEADIDCGGSCEPCSLGRRCRLPTDCMQALCVAGLCRASQDASGDAPRSSDATSADARNDADAPKITADVTIDTEATVDVFDTDTRVSSDDVVVIVDAIQAR